MRALRAYFSALSVMVEICTFTSTPFQDSYLFRIGGWCYFPFSWHMYCAHEIASLTRAKLPASIASWILPTRQASHPCSSRARIKIDKISIELSFCRPGPACLRSTWSNNHLPEAYNALIKGLPMGYAIRICNQDMQSGYAIRICNQDMQYQYPIGKPSQTCQSHTFGEWGPSTPYAAVMVTPCPSYADARFNWTRLITCSPISQTRFARSRHDTAKLR